MTGIAGIPVAWFDEADYPEFLRIMEDDNLHPTWGEWLDHANKLLAEHERLGLKIRKVVIHPKEFADWCAACGRKVQSAERAMFAAHKAGRHIGD